MRKLVGAGIAVLAVATFALLIARAQRLPEGPQPIAWDREPCAHCHMHVGDPHFAAQLQTREGDVLSFDDPGCLLSYQAERRPDVHAIWFHHLREDRWIAAPRVAFVAVEGSPMGFGLGAVDAGRPGSIDQAQATALVMRKGQP